MKKILSLAAVIALTLLLAVPVFAGGELVVDDADIITSEEETALKAALKELQDKYGVDVIVVTTDSIDGYSLQDYADNYYDQHGYSKDGIELLINMDTYNGGANRKYIISTAGYGITAFTDYGIDKIYDDMYPFLKDGNYMGAFTQYAYDADWMLEQARSGEPFDVPKPAKPTMANISWGPIIIFALILGAVISLIIVSSMKKQHKSVAKQKVANSYVVPGSLNLVKSTDTFLYVNVTHVPIPQNNNNTRGGGFGGGSSIHISSGGFTHGGGGGGRSF